MRVKELFHFIRERQSIYLAREAGAPKPWTHNSILQNWRFTNVYRENDVVTRWIVAHWCRPHKDCPELWFALCIARLLNNPRSLSIISWPVPWEPRTFVRKLIAEQQAGNKVFNPAYIVSTNGRKMNKVEYIARCVLTPLWKQRAVVRKSVHNANTLAEVHAVLTQFNGLGSFLAAQVIADLKEIPPLKNAVDWHTWAASGPGSRRGLNRVCNREITAPWKERNWLTTLQQLQARLNPMIIKLGWLPLCAQNTQNSLCEFDKYERVRLGQGRAKQKYQGV